MSSEYVGDGVTNNPGKALGWTFGGFIAQVFLAGISIPPIYTYYVHEGKRDCLGLKLVVLFMIIFNWGHLVCSYQMMYFYSVDMAGNPEGLSKIPWGIIPMSSLAKTGIALAQSFFCYRIYIVLHRNKLVALGFCLLLLTEIGAGIYLSVELSKFTSFVQFRQHKAPFVLEEFTPFVIDVIILISTVLVFRDALPIFGKRNGIDSTPSRLVRFIKQTVLYSIQINTFTAAVALTTGLLYLLYHDASAYAGISLIQPFIYQLTILITLNARSSQRQRLFANPQSPEDVTLKTVDLNPEHNTQYNENSSNSFQLASSKDLTSISTNDNSITAKGSSEKLSIYSTNNSQHVQHYNAFPPVPIYPITTSLQEHTIHIPHLTPTNNEHGTTAIKENIHFQDLQ